MALTSAYVRDAHAVNFLEFNKRYEIAEAGEDTMHKGWADWMQEAGEETFDSLPREKRLALIILCAIRNRLQKSNRLSYSMGKLMIIPRSFPCCMIGCRRVSSG